MLLTFDRGDSRRPKGHALLYFRSWSDSSAVFATYLIVPPIDVEISKYIPPMFAAQFQQMASTGVSVFPYPPIPEQVESYGFLERMARLRDDDLVSAGTVDTSSPERLLHGASEAAQQYYQSFVSHLNSITSETETEALPSSAESQSLEVNEILYGLMGERDRLAQMAKLAGQLRYAVGARDASLETESVAELERLDKYLPEKYRLKETLLVARQGGSQADRLTELYLERAYKIADEDYERVSELEAEIQRLKP